MIRIQRGTGRTPPAFRQDRKLRSDQLKLALPFGFDSADLKNFSRLTGREGWMIPPLSQVESSSSDCLLGSGRDVPDIGTS